MGLNFRIKKTDRSMATFIGFALMLCFSVELFAISGNIGIVDMQRVILSVEEGKAARSKLEKEFKAKEKDLIKQKEELDKLNEDWKKQSALLSEKARMEKQQDFQQKFLKLRQAEMDFQNEIKQKEQKETQKIAIKIQGVVDELAKAKKLSAVFETSTAGLLYLENPVDLTQDVISAYDKKKTAEVKKK